MWPALCRVLCPPFSRCTETACLCAAMEHARPGHQVGGVATMDSTRNVRAWRRINNIGTKARIKAVIGAGRHTLAHHRRRMADSRKVGGRLIRRKAGTAAVSRMATAAAIQAGTSLTCTSHHPRVGTIRWVAGVHVQVGAFHLRRAIARRVRR